MIRDLKFIDRQPLKADIPWRKRRKIRQLECEIDRLWTWFYRTSIALEGLVITILALCILHYQIHF